MKQALTNAMNELKNIHADMLAHNEHAPNGCPCSDPDSDEACPVAAVIAECEAALC